MILNHLLQSNPGHAGRPGQQGGSAPSGTPPPPPGAAQAYNNLTKKSIEIPDNEAEYKTLSDEYTKIFQREAELRVKVFNRTATSDEKKEWNALKLTKDGMRLKLGVYERKTRKDSLDTRLNQENELKKNPKPSTKSGSTQTKSAGGWKTPDAKKTYQGMLAKVSQMNAEYNERTQNFKTTFSPTAPDARDQLKSYIEFRQAYEKAVQEKANFFSSNYVMGQ